MVVDASALLAFLLGETGAEIVECDLPGAWVSAVNLAEVLSRFEDLGIQSDRLPALLRSHGVKFVPFDTAAAVGAATLRAVTKSAGLSLGDRACIQLACDKSLPALTADRAWKNLDLPVEVHLIR